MNKPRLILHIGTHKTGTSSIQAFLQDSKIPLAGLGVCYPPTEREPWPQLPKHCSVFAAASRADPAAAEAERKWLIEQGTAPDVHTLVVSEEGLSEPSPQLVEFFRPLAAHFEIQVVCFLRRPDLFLESLYNQFVREAARKESRPISLFVRAKPVRERLEYATILKRWATLPADVKVVDFDAAVAGGDLVEHFVTVTGLGLSPSRPYRSNSSPDMRLVQLLCRLNRQRVPYDLHRILQAGAALQREMRFEKARYALGRRERMALLEELSPSLLELKNHFGIEFSNDLPPEPAASIEDVDPAYLLELAAKLSRDMSQ